MPALSERRKRDRVLMIGEIKVLAASLGIEVEIRLEEGDPENTISPRETILYLLDPKGLAVSIGIDGESVQPDVHVVSWHMSHGSDLRLAETFGQVNPHHRRKATAVAYGFEALKRELTRGFELSKSGEAYL